jgi:phosphoglycerol transferase MdoB-like AlkP superfamily enzyme
MKNKYFGTPKLKFLYSLFFFQIVLYTLYRVIFLVWFKNDISPDSGAHLLNSFIFGFRFDARLAMALLVPAIVFINLPLNPAFKVRLQNGLYTLLLSAVTFIYILDIGYYSYLKTRVNATILQFFKNPIISLQMVSESYPVILLVLLIIMLTIVIWYILRTFITPALMGSPLNANNRTRWFGGVIFFLLFAWGLYGSVKAYPLRWSEAFASPDTLTSNLSLNPVLYITDTYTFRNKEFEKDKAQEHYDLVARFLGVDEALMDKENLNFVRSFPEDSSKRAVKPNVVYIVMESMAFYKSGLGGSKVNPTPNLDAISKESLLFTNFYTPTVATARSIFAAVTSIPDTSKVKTGSRNPFIVNQHTIMGEFNDYQKYYFLGGSANWGNIRGVFSNNIPGLKIYEEGSYKSPRVDVWGISDLNLFKESFGVINDKEKTKEPFFAFIQSAGFHRPYTIPNDSDDFKIMTPKDISEKEIRDYGFDSFEEFNAMRLQDYSLGKFMEMAKKSPWYANTIFVIHGDHGLPDNHAVNVQDWQRQLLNGYHVPFIIHYPKAITPGVETKIASEVDTMPTIAAMAGIPYKTRSLGRDLFNPKFDDYRAAFSYNWSPPFNISLIDKDFYFEYIPYNGQGKLINYSADPSGENVKDKFPEKYEEMKTLTKGLYESARFLLNNNPRMN